jgi:hypothetical protein
VFNYYDAKVMQQQSAHSNFSYTKQLFIVFCLFWILIVPI